ncbi:MAG: class I SAM-dependent methyltransferase [Clostridia bacterium]|nr:class I SAM-dependent methyltransferase [Clostridia bacterium]
MDWKKESEMFNLAADYYDKFRPSYPQEMIDILISETGIKANSKLLEIGAGSGKATELFTNKGFDILCIEPGKDLVKIGNERFKDVSIRFEAARFEECDLPKQYYDVIFAAQAFHWVPQPIGYERCAYALKEKAFLAPFWNMYITYDNVIDNELLEISNKYGGFADFLSEKECEIRINSIVTGIENSKLFSSPKVFRKLWRQAYTADEFFGFALTGNRFIQKSEEEKQFAYRELVSLADNHNGIIERTYLCVLYLSQKL